MTSQPLVTERSPEVRPVVRGSTRRWSIAIGISLVALLGAAVAIQLAAAGGAASRLAGWAPSGTVAYAEVRLDALRDPSGDLARFLANFPGFADRARFDEKTTELADRLLDRLTDGELSYSEMKPWLGDAAAVAIPALPVSMSDGSALLILATSDPAALRDWIAAQGEIGGGSATHGGVEMNVGRVRGVDWAYVVLDSVLLAGERSAVEAAIDTNGRSDFPSSPRFRDALASLEGDPTGFAFLDGSAVRARLDGLEVATMGMGALASSAVADWYVAGLRYESDGIEAEIVAPRPAILDEDAFPAPTNRTSGIANRIPGNALAVLETRDVGATLVALLAKVSDDAAASGSDPTDALGVVGNGEALIGWLGDAALVLLPGAEHPDGALLGLVEDEAAALATTRQLRALLTFAAGDGVAVDSEEYGDGTITTLTVEEPERLLDAIGGSTGSEGRWDRMAHGPVTLAWTVQGGLLVAASTPEVVRAILDTAEAESLAASSAYRVALERVGVANAGQGWLDLPALVRLVLPRLDAADRAAYDRDLAPFIDRLGGAAGAARSGDPMRVHFTIPVR